MLIRNQADPRELSQRCSGKPILGPHQGGWLLCHHGARVTASGSIYRLGLALLGRDDPTKVLARGNEWVFGPQEP
jgi:predicted GH43/DUF377 family glycosyl hydrolase